MNEPKRTELIAKTEVAYDIMVRVCSDISILPDPADPIYQMSREVCRTILTLRGLLKGDELWQIQTR